MLIVFLNSKFKMLLIQVLHKKNPKISGLYGCNWKLTFVTCSPYSSTFYLDILDKNLTILSGDREKYGRCLPNTRKGCLSSDFSVYSYKT